MAIDAAEQDADEDAEEDRQRVRMHEFLDRVPELLAHVVEQFAFADDAHGIAEFERRGGGGQDLDAGAEDARDVGLVAAPDADLFDRAPGNLAAGDEHVKHRQIAADFALAG